MSVQIYMKCECQFLVRTFQELFLHVCRDLSFPLFPPYLLSFVFSSFAFSLCSHRSNACASFSNVSLHKQIPSMMFFIFHLLSTSSFFLFHKKAQQSCLRALITCTQLISPKHRPLNWVPTQSAVVMCLSYRLLFSLVFNYEDEIKLCFCRDDTVLKKC